MKSGAESEHMSICSELAAYGDRESGVMLYSSWFFWFFFERKLWTTWFISCNLQDDTHFCKTS